MGKLNHFICPRCGHDFYATGAYATCDACQTFFYASQSRTCNLADKTFTINAPQLGTIIGPLTGGE